MPTQVHNMLKSDEYWMYRTLLCRTVTNWWMCSIQVWNTRALWPTATIMPSVTVAAI